MRFLLMFAVFFTSYLQAATYVDGDFDHDGVKDKYEIKIEKEMKLIIHLSSVNQERVYSWEHLDSPDDGFSNLYRYGDRNYIVYSYSDFRDNSDYVEDIYSWNPDINEMVLYLPAEVKNTGARTSISTKMAKCCTVAGDQLNQPAYLDSSESAVRAQELVDLMYLKIQGNTAHKHSFINEEISFINSNYKAVNKNKYIDIANFLKEQGDKISWCNIMGRVDGNQPRVCGE